MSVVSWRGVLSGRGPGQVAAAVGALAALLAVWAGAAPRPARVFGAPPEGLEVKVVGRLDEELAPRSEIAAPRYLGPQEDDTVLAAVIGWGAVAIVVALVVLLVVVLVRRFLEAYGDRRVDADSSAGPTPDRVAVAVATDADERLAALSRGTPREGIIAAWTRLETVLREVGVPLPASRTSTDTVVDVLGRFVVDAAALEGLALLYREAAWSQHRVSEDDRARAEAALRTLDAGLTVPVRTVSRG